MPQEPADGLLGDVGGIPDALMRRIPGVPAQIATVCRERMRGEPALDVEVGEPVLDGPLERSEAQLSTCPMVTESIPKASATAP